MLFSLRLGLPSLCEPSIKKKYMYDISFYFFQGILCGATILPMSSEMSPSESLCTLVYHACEVNDVTWSNEIFRSPFCMEIVYALPRLWVPVA